MIVQHGVACGLREDGTVKCSEASYTPPEHERFVDIDGSEDGGCGARDDGYVVCWGDFRHWNQDDLLKDKKFMSIVVSAKADRWVQPFACGLREDGSVDCWGRGMRDDIDGDGIVGHNEVYSFPENARFKFLSAGKYHVCGLKTDDTVVCIGENDHGQASPPQGEQFIDLDVSNYYSCGVNKAGVIVCWGDNSDGQSHPPLR